MIIPSDSQSDDRSYPPTGNRNMKLVKSEPIYSSQSTVQCVFCSKAHQVHQCQNFKALSPDDRYSFIMKNRLCVNCLRKYSPSHKCSDRRCYICQSKHHSLLHDSSKVNNFKKPPTQTSHFVTQSKEGTSFNQVESFNTFKGSDDNQPATPSTSAPSSEENQIESAHFCSEKAFKGAAVILPTAVVLIKDKQGNSHGVTALLDSGASVNLISRELAEKLALPSSPTNIQLQTVSDSSTSVSNYVSTTILSRSEPWQAKLDFLVVNSISSNLEPICLSANNFNLPKGIQLADPDIFKRRKLHLLLGVEAYSEIMAHETLTLSPDLPKLIHSRLGWVAVGKYRPRESKPDNVESSFHVVTNEELSVQVNKFWELESIGSTKPLSSEEQLCLNHFQETTTTQGGRFVVSLPFKKDPQVLGNSFNQAFKRFLSLETRFAKNPTFASCYKDVVHEYLDLGYLMPVSNQVPTTPHYYLAHHGVTKTDSTTTALRIVYDGSARTSTGYSLNDCLAKGPVVQADLFDILLMFRLHKYAISADIQQMYLQVKVTENCRGFQRIIWRDEPHLPLKHFELSTVTFGLTSSPFLATQALKEGILRAITDSSKEILEPLLNSFYVDDFLVSFPTEEQAVVAVERLNSALHASGFNLRKWISNSPQIMKQIPKDLHFSSSTKNLVSVDQIKTLGMKWDSASDSLSVAVNFNQFTDKFPDTKRKILSVVARVFDPTGLVAPIVIRAKIILQALWKSQCSWDSVIPTSLFEQWKEIFSSLCRIHQIQIPRQLLSDSFPTTIQLCGFADASLMAYGACVYLRCICNSGQVKVSLIAAKSRVAPLKEISVPKLELLAAVLLSKLIHKLRERLSKYIQETLLFLDSMDILHMIAKPAHKRTVFFSLRILQIQNLTAGTKWRHVSSKDNIADLISRGCSTEQLIADTAWWHGPTFLRTAQLPDSQDFCPPLTQDVVMHNIPTFQPLLDLIQRISSYNRILRVTAWILRFIRNAKDPSNPKENSLTAQELDEAELQIVRAVQSVSFPSEIKALKFNLSFPSKSNLIPLTPFLEHGLLRVGGRLEHSNLPYDMKHQLILPKDHVLTKRLILDTHRRLGHAGAQLVCADLRQRFWITSIQRSVKSVLRSCILCFRRKAKTYEQLMADLPPERIIPAPPFQSTGVDFLGPIRIKVGTPRSKTLTKAYVALFICLVTRAVHCEAVLSLSTNDFLQAFARFTARRGLPNTVFSDNGTQFRRASKELQELSMFLSKLSTRQDIQDYAAKHRVKWLFIPPRTPHAGGVWETNVKSFKDLFYKEVADRHLTYEEFITVVTQVEAILNSRPLAPVNEDPTNLDILTPAHFLTGRSIVAYPFPITEQQMSLSTRWQRVQELTVQLWRRWSQTYLVEQQRRMKWHSKSPQIKVGTMVIIKDERLPPCQWNLAKIIKLYPGRDNKIRVVDVKTSQGIYKRSIHALCPLPFEANGERSYQT